ncbi:MAG: hypothetical protein OXQ94_07525 [Gemmatimonadota bacterium]|nr:hypothetical protein [Gemmatimonadota bacterium]MDE2871518.1 hypothetical protein [Gemmatimonadota bacterium]
MSGGITDMYLVSLPLTTMSRLLRRPGRNGVVPRTLLCAAAIAASTIGCESTIPAVVEDTALVTDGTGFRIEREGGGRHIWYGGEIPYSFTNRTGSKVYLPNCRGGFDVTLEMEKDGEWVHIFSPILLDCLSPPIVIEPDEVYETTLRVVGCLEGNCGPRLVLPPSSSTPVRIVWGDALSSYDEDANPFGELIPLEERVSNRFTLQVSR